ISARPHVPSRPLTIHRIVIKSGQLGALEASPAELDGPMTPLSSSLDILDIGALGPKAQVEVQGSMLSMNVGSIDLGPTGKVEIAGDVSASAPSQSSSSTSTSDSGTSQAITIGGMELQGGRFTIGRDVLGPISIDGDLTITQDGLLSIGRDE